MIFDFLKFVACKARRRLNVNKIYEDHHFRR